MAINNCDFCDELSEGKDNTFASIYGEDPTSRVLLRTPNFAVVPSLGQMVEGYLLVVPTRHYTAMADLSEGLLDELSSLCQRVQDALAQTYGPPLLFEHGVRGNQSGGCGVDHAHMHAVPLTGSRDPLVEIRRRHRLRALRGISEIHKKVRRNSSYLYFEDTNGLASAFEIGFIRSQYVRKMLADSVGISRWDWREYGREEALLRSLERLSQILNSQSTISSEGPALPDCLKTVTGSAVN